MMFNGFICSPYVAVSACYILIGFAEFVSCEKIFFAVFDTIPLKSVGDDFTSVLENRRLGMFFGFCFCACAFVLAIY